jgi:WD40 repeat protein
MVAVGVGRGLSVFRLDGGTPSVIAQCSRGLAVAGATTRDGLRLALACDDGSVMSADWDGRVPASPLGRGHSKAVVSLNFSPDGSQLVSASEDKTVIVWDVAGRREMNRFSDSKKPYVFAGFTTNGTSIVALTDSGQLFEWDAKSGRSLRNTMLTDNSVFSGAINAGGTILAMGTELARLNKGGFTGPASPSDYYREDHLLLYDLTKGSIVKEIDGVDGQLRSLSFSSDNRFLTAARQKVRRTYVSVYDLQRGVEVFSQEALDRGVLAEFSPNGRYLAALSLQGQIAIFKVSGVTLSSGVGDLAGQRIRPTSSSLEPLLGPSASLTLAILDLDSLGVEKSVGRQVAEMLRAAIVGANLRVVASDRMQEVIKQQNFELSDRTDPSTAVALGKILNATKMIFGSVGVLDTTYTVSVQLVDVETGRVEGVREVMCQRCGLGDLPAVVATLRPLLTR